MFNVANISCRWFHESSRWLVLSKKSEQAIKNLKSVAKFNGRCEEGDKINIKVKGSGVFVLLCHLSYKINCWFESTFSLCTDAAGVHEEGDVRFPGFLFFPGSVPHNHNADDDSLPQRCLVHVMYLS